MVLVKVNNIASCNKKYLHNNFILNSYNMHNLIRFGR
jgi:hypothetical protein